MADHICVGIKRDGVRCTTRVAGEQQRCGVHLRTVETHGPNTTAVRELRYVHTRELSQLRIQWTTRIINEHDEVRKEALAEDFNHEYRVMKARNDHDMRLLIRQHRQQIRLTGIDPDDVATRRREELEARRRQEFRERIDAIMIENQERAINLANNVLQREDVVRPRGDLEAFAADGQNIHTERTVKMTKDMVAIIMSISVPDEYKWSPTECSKTPGEIIMTCKLSLKAAWQMTAKYCQEESIYGLGKGIYGKVLDGVWQYILNSPDKSDLCCCLKQEMEDNIGMCAQGNLSRLCNILAGYIEGIGSQESLSEVLGRLMPRLMEIDDLGQRLNEAYNIMKDNNVPLAEWTKWLAPLTMDQDVTMDVGLLRNGDGNVIGIIANEV